MARLERVCGLATLLSDERAVLKVRYARDDQIASREDLVVDSMRILSKTEAQSATSLAYVRPEDLP